ncbi:alpha/beta hydrolase [Nannocystis punicea]|uniref:Alpha/beta hydrolase n=1 Tax=Nannocystis punicea TaxID=2995304 RepID=A0ABY7H7Z4_9BACT|nr:alpha/beta hydrolase [Nannocystis poenicansa]WAS95207.1 alpha/beta hydrolase [Nannocystis poenicansa]
MSIDITNQPLVYSLPGAADVVVESHHYETDAGPLGFDLYRPPRRDVPAPAVVFVSGLPDPGVVGLFGKPLKDWASYVGWARMVAAAGLVGVTYLNREPGDVVALVRHLRAHAGELGLDPARLAVWACSGNVPTALGLLARERFAGAALLYGYMLDLDGATDVAEAARQYYFAVPPVGLHELPRDVPLLLVRAGRDATPGLDATLRRFVAAGRGRGLSVTVLEHLEGPHAFDLVDDSAATREAIEGVLSFLRRALGRGESSG